MSKDIERIKRVLNTLTSNVIFNEEEHTYTIKGNKYKPVSNTIKDYNRGIDKVPEHIMKKAVDRGNEIHKFMEWYLKENEGVFDEDIQTYINNNEHKDYLNKGVEYMTNELESGWRILSVEQVLYNTPNRICGTADLLMYRVGETIEIKIVDWKSGSIKLSNYIQIEIYKRFLEHSLNRLKIDNMSISTELVSLKTVKDNKMTEKENKKNKDKDFCKYTTHNKHSIWFRTEVNERVCVGCDKSEKEINND